MAEQPNTSENSTLRRPHVHALIEAILARRLGQELPHRTPCGKLTAGAPVSHLEGNRDH